MTVLNRRNISWIVSITLLTCAPAFGQALRDPTQPPAAFSAPAGSPRLAVDDFKFEQLVNVNGVRYVVWNSRRYTVGDTINGARIERITENSISLKNAGTVRVIQLFPSIEKRAAGSATAANASNRNSLDSKDGTKK